MKHNLSYNRKLFSHSIKCMMGLLPSHPSKHDPTSPHHHSATPKEKSSIKRKKTKASLIKLEEQHKAYEEMIDELMREHVEDQNLPLALGKLSIRRTYNNYRVINSHEDTKEQITLKLTQKINEISPRTINKSFRTNNDTSASQRKQQRSRSFELPPINYKINQNIIYSSSSKLNSFGRKVGKSYTEA